MTIDRRTLLALSGAALVAGCADPDPQGSGSPTPEGKDAVTVGLTYIPNVQFCAFYLGVEEGLFGDLDVTLRHHGEQESLFEALQLGREDIVFASADEAVIAGGLATVATAYQQYPAEVMVAGRADGLADLRGRTLGIPGRFGSSYYAALAALNSAGLTEKDVKLVEIGFTTVTALTTGKVDAVVGFTNNELVQSQREGFEVPSLPVSDEATLVGPSLITREDDAKAPWVEQCVQGMLAAERRAVEDPEAALDATAAQVPALAEPGQRANAKRVLQATSALWRGDDGELSVDVDAKAMQRMETFLREAGIEG